MGLAALVGRDSASSGKGTGIGVVITERAAEGEGEKVVAVAGDARYALPVNAHTSRRRENPGAHAVLRAIALVAAKRRILASDPGSPRVQEPTGLSITHTNVEDLTALERKYFWDLDTLRKGGYLCLHLRVYVTHEPCVCCAMALVHSRVGSVVFGKDMRMTGGFVVEEGSKVQADGGKVKEIREMGCGRDQGKRKASGYGLFWREDLNWRFLAFRFVADTPKAADADEGLSVAVECVNGKGEPFLELPPSTQA